MLKFSVSGRFSHQNPGGSVTACSTAGQKNRSFDEGLRRLGVLLAFVDAANYNTFTGLASHVFGSLNKMQL